MKSTSPITRFTITLFLLFTSTFVLAQKGKHGAVIISNLKTVVNEFTQLTVNANAGEGSIVVANSALNDNNRFANNLEAGDLIYIIQLQGASINSDRLTAQWGEITAYNNCGNNEFAEVEAVPNATHINLSCALKNDYTTSGKVLVVRVPRYSSLTITSGGELTTDDWNGISGGIISIEVQGNTTINGLIDASERGFRAGMQDDITSPFTEARLDYAYLGDTLRDEARDGAEKGESIAGYHKEYDFLGGRYGRGAPANGGGGGNGHNAAGGGGANAGIVSDWNGQGNPNNSIPNWATAWDLESINFSNNTSSGGGRGGYSYATSLQNTGDSPLTVGPNNQNWGGNWRRNVGGLGGRPLDNLSGRLFYGGGGGCGDDNNRSATGAGDGGGIIYILSYGIVSGTGKVISNGGQGGDTFAANGRGVDAGGGGGAGGTIVINALTGANIGVLTEANGGRGGNQQTTSIESEGPGGGGGGGYISISPASTVACTVNGAASGRTSSPTMVEFTPNGSTAGGDGLIVNAPAFQLSTSTVCQCNPGKVWVDAIQPGLGEVIWYDKAVGGNEIGRGDTLFISNNICRDTMFFAETCLLDFRDTAFIFVNETIQIGPVSHLCAADDLTYQVNFQLFGGTAPYAIDMPGNQTGSPIITYTSNPIVAGDPYKIGISDLNSGGCTVDTVQGQANCPTICNSFPIVDAGASGNICGLTSFTINGASAFDGTDFLPLTDTSKAGIKWSHNGLGTLENDTILQPTYQPIVADFGNTITFTLVGLSGELNQVHCPDASSTSTLLVLAAATANITNKDSTICGSNSPISITGTVQNNNGFTWAHNGTGTLSNTQTLTPSYIPGPNENGTITFILSATAEAPCQNATDTLLITLIENTVANPGPDAVLCAGDTYNFTNVTIRGATNSNWTSNGAGIFNQTNQLSPTYESITSEGGDTLTFTLHVSGALGCQDTIREMKLIIHSQPQVIVGGNDSICVNSNYSITGDTVINTAAFSWSHNGTGTFSPSAAVLHPNYIPGKGDEKNTVQITLTAYPNTPCSNTAVASFNLFVAPDVSVNAGDNGSMCITGAYTLTNSTVDNESSFSWSHNGSGSFDDSLLLNPTYTADPKDADRLLTFTLKAYGKGKCTVNQATDKVTVRIISEPSISIENGISCAEIPFEFSIDQSNVSSTEWTHNGQGNFSKSSGNYTYTADISDTAVNFTIVGMPEDPCVTTASSQAQIIVNHLEKVAIIGSPICNGAVTTLTLDPKSDNPSYTHSWYFDNNSGDFEQISPTKHQPTLTVSDVGNYFVTVDNFGNCGAHSDPFKLESSNVDVEVEEFYTIKLDEAVEIIPKYTFTQQTGNETYDWAITHSPTTIGTNETIVVSPKDTTNYTIRVTDQTGCSGLATTTLLVQHPIKIYELVSPNGDGQNDAWLINNIENFPNATVQVMNRWGDIVFEKTGYRNDWDGTRNGKKLPVATYYYLVNLNEGNKKPYAGHLVIIY